MGFNWKSALGTIIPTVGTIVGKFLGASDKEGALLYQFSGEEDAHCEASFIKNNGHIVLWNRSEDENALLTLSLPKVGSLEPQTITLQQGDTLVVDPLFAECANCDSTKIMLAASNNTAALKKGMDGVREQFHICAAASDVRTDNSTVRLGSYLTINCTPTEATFSCANYQIKHISIANFQGRNDQKVKVMDIPAEASKTSQNGTEVKVSFPTPFSEDTILDVDVEVEMGSLAAILEEQKKLYDIHKLCPEEAQLLKSIPVIRS